MTKTGHAFTPAKSRSYRNRLSYEASLAWDDKQPSELPAILKVNVFVQAPKNLKAAERKMVESGLPLINAKRPDADNYLKMVMDSLNGIILRDDAQIYSAMVNKWLSNKPRIEVELIIGSEEND